MYKRRKEAPRSLVSLGLVSLGYALLRRLVSNSLGYALLHRLVGLSLGYALLHHLVSLSLGHALLHCLVGVSLGYALLRRHASLGYILLIGLSCASLRRHSSLGYALLRRLVGLSCIDTSASAMSRCADMPASATLCCAASSASAASPALTTLCCAASSASAALPASTTPPCKTYHGGMEEQQQRCARRLLQPNPQALNQPRQVDHASVTHQLMPVRRRSEMEPRLAWRRSKA